MCIVSDSEEKTNLRIRNYMNFKWELGHESCGAVRNNQCYRKRAPGPGVATADKRHQRARLKIRQGEARDVIEAKAF